MLRLIVIINISWKVGQSEDCIEEILTINTSYHHYIITITEGDDGTVVMMLS